MKKTPLISRFVLGLLDSFNRPLPATVALPVCGIGIALVVFL